ncbi:helix-turn-helix transcriptional regulator [Streptomyces sp. NPDC056716]|uniref:helix-turn-helix transcriptional regulator n=1 Tax=unclassified Streptomyces TaxID=2593676 RepID=UPI0036A3430B
MTAAPHPEHGVEDLCPAGLALYELALREGSVAGATAAQVPCLVDTGLLVPALTDLDRLEPVSPALALQHFLRASALRVADERLRETRLTQLLEPLIGIGGRAGPPADPGVSALSGLRVINDAIARAMAATTEEMLCVQPHNGLVGKPVESHAEAIRRDQELLDRGARIRTLYQHTLRYVPITAGRYEQLSGDVEARTLDEVTERLIILDREVAFLPANPDRTLALEIRVPALVTFLATTFDRLWHLATPMYPQAVRQPALNGVTHRQHAIARLLVDGLTDAVIAERLGMNIRTARVHIAKLAATLGSESRAQLGYLIARSGILDPDREG